jgi:hypothetical protein
MGLEVTGPHKPCDTRLGRRVMEIVVLLGDSRLLIVPSNPSMFPDMSESSFPKHFLDWMVTLYQVQTCAKVQVHSLTE